MTDTSIFTTDQLEEQFRTNSRLCLEAATNVYKHLHARKQNLGPVAVVDLPISEVVDIIYQTIPIRLSDRRVDALGSDLADVLQHFGLTTCLVYNLAHCLDHVIYDQDA